MPGALLLLFAASAAFLFHADFVRLGWRNFGRDQLLFWGIFAIALLQLVYSVMNDPRGLGGNSYALMFLTLPGLFIVGVGHLLKTLSRLFSGKSRS